MNYLFTVWFSLANWMFRDDLLLFRVSLVFKISSLVNCISASLASLFRIRITYKVMARRRIVLVEDLWHGGSRNEHAYRLITMSLNHWLLLIDEWFIQGIWCQAWHSLALHDIQFSACAHWIRIFRPFGQWFLHEMLIILNLTSRCNTICASSD